MDRGPVIAGHAVLHLAGLLLIGSAACAKHDPCGADERPCKEDGRCTLEGKSCVATDESICSSSEYCKWEGRCHLRQGKCVAIENADCKKSTACSQGGRCAVDADGFCIVGSRKDCENRVECYGGRCDVRNGGCVVVREAPNVDDQEGGCPCGCDHSEQMASELMEASTGDAETAIEQSLHTIAEREDAGYITWAMVTHRRRLLATSRERLGFVPEGRGVPTPPCPIAPSGSRATASSCAPS
ncbi:MAG: hypothetical protein JNK04_02195 [Myxococcales bacterium]|nr:hypothetical protein [Myxococcales bacterium]